MSTHQSHNHRAMTYPGYVYTSITQPSRHVASTITNNQTKIVTESTLMNLEGLLCLLLGLYRVDYFIFVTGWIQELKSGFGKTFLRSRNNTPDETNAVSKAVSCYKEAAQF